MSNMKKIRLIILWFYQAMPMVCYFTFASAGITVEREESKKKQNKKKKTSIGNDRTGTLGSRPQQLIGQHGQPFHAWGLHVSSNFC